MPGYSDSSGKSYYYVPQVTTERKLLLLAGDTYPEPQMQSLHILTLGT
jgi:hypothetical protein